MSTGGSEYTLSVRLNVTNLAEVRNQIAGLGGGVGTGGGGANAGAGRGGGGATSAASAPGYAGVAAATAAGTKTAAGMQALIRQQANLAVNTAIRSGGYMAALQAMQKLALGETLPGMAGPLTEPQQIGFQNRAMMSESGMNVRVAQARLDIAQATRKMGLVGKAEQLQKLAADESFSPAQRLSFATQLEGTLSKIQAREDKAEERRYKQEVAREKAKEKAEERAERERERQERAAERAEKRVARARERAEVAKSSMEGGLFGKAETLHKYSKDPSIPEADRLGYQRQLYGTMERIEKSTEAHERREAASADRERRAQEREARERRRVERAREGVSVAKAQASDGLFGKANALYTLSQDKSIPEAERLKYEKQLHTTMGQIERNTAAHERRQASGGRSGGGSGGARSGGLGAMAGQFFGVPSPMGLYFAAVFGGWELGQAKQRIATAEMGAALAPNKIARMQAELEAAVAGFQGPIGGMVGLAMDTFGIGGPETIRRQMMGAIGYEAARERARDESLRTNVVAAGANVAKHSTASQYQAAIKTAEAQYNLSVESPTRNIKEIESRLRSNEAAIAHNKQERARYQAQMAQVSQEMLSRHFSPNSTGGLMANATPPQTVQPMDLKDELPSEVVQALKLQINAEREQIKQAKILRDESTREAKEKLRDSIFTMQQQAEASRINAAAQGNNASSIETYRRSRELERNAMLYGRVITTNMGVVINDPGLPDRLKAFNEETEATIGRMERLKELEISRYQSGAHISGVIAAEIRGRKPYDAAKSAAMGRYLEAINQAEGIQDEKTREAAKRKAKADYDREIAQIETDYENRKEEIGISQRTRMGQMSALESRREYGARVIGIGGSSMAAARGLFNEGFVDQAREELSLGIRQVNLAKRDYLEAFRGVQFDVRNIGMSDRDTEDIEGTLNDIHQTIKELAKAIEGLVAN